MYVGYPTFIVDHPPDVKAAWSYPSSGRGFCRLLGRMTGPERSLVVSKHIPLFRSLIPVLKQCLYVQSGPQAKLCSKQHEGIRVSRFTWNTKGEYFTTDHEAFSTIQRILC
jgi:hypothetical protein